MRASPALPYPPPPCGLKMAEAPPTNAISMRPAFMSLMALCRAMSDEEQAAAARQGEVRRDGGSAFFSGHCKKMFKLVIYLH